MRKILVLILISLLSIYTLCADEGDTIIIQTIDHNTPVLPGWNSPRGGTYLFPSDSISFSKILMSYNLKCDPGQSPACGEWDYLTYTKVYENTGEFDSTLYSQPNYVVFNSTPDSFMMMNSPSFTYIPILEHINSTNPTNTYTPGNQLGISNLPFNSNSNDGRGQFIFTVDELINSGLQNSEITGLAFNILSGEINLKHFTIKFAHVDIDALDENTFYETAFTTVFSRNTNLSVENDNIPFSFPFIWDEVSNILVDISYSGSTGSVSLKSDDVDINTGVISQSYDGNLYFEAWDYVEVPKEVFSTIDSAITISFWQYGNPAIQPINSSIFEGVDSMGQRVLNVHLPWSNGNIYWDAGYDGYDRIYRGASESEFEGQWNFWTFIKDSRSGSMQILLNGDLWFIGNGRTKSMANINRFIIGAAVSYNGYYAGSIDDFRIWDTVISWDNVKDWMYKEINPSHPNYNHLRVYYKFNDENGNSVTDSSPNSFNGSMFGYPSWKSYSGSNIFKNSLYTDSRISINFEVGNYNSANLDSIVVIDTLENTQVNIVRYDPNNPPNPLDTLTRWPAYYDNYFYDAGGNAIDSTMVPADEILYRDDIEYYGEPYEVTIPWEIARYITPYGNGLSLGDDGWTWTFDVTDYRHLLADSVYITAGNFQELLDLEFHMIEGTPPREVLKLDKIYSGSFALNNMSQTVVPDTIALLPEAETFKVITRTSGHQFDNPTNCAEFCYKIHDLKVNGTMVKEWEIMQECADNPLHPQGGTWIYDRAGWCPGAKVTQQDIEITPFVDSDTVIIDYESQYDDYGNYVLVTHLVSYGDYNFVNDATISEVIAPNNDKVYSKFNPSAGAPLVIIKSYGSDELTSLTIHYGPEGTIKEYTWTGSLTYGEEETIELEEFNWGEWETGNGVFIVTASNPNGQSDDNPINDNYRSNYDMVPVYPGTIVQHFKTNKAASQNSWEIRLNNDMVILERDDFEMTTLYIDTISFPVGLYKYYLWDTGHNGISFWANTQGSGYLRWYDLEGNILKSFNGDFGDRIYHSFYSDMYLGNNETSVSNDLSIYPNPGNGNFFIELEEAILDDSYMAIYNSEGKIVRKILLDKGINKVEINLEDIPSGVYTCSLLTSEGIKNSKLIIK